MDNVLATALLGTFVGVCLVGVDATAMDATDATGDARFVDELTDNCGFTGSVFLEGDVG